MNVDMQEARRLIILAIKNNPSGVGYDRLDRAFVSRMPDMIIGYGNKLMPLLDEMTIEGVINSNNGHYTKGPNFPKDL